ncbi:MAG TPA: carbohydrate kinase [Nevskiaceae bacterium]|nr:carbohydrate kinase [Nevskiaceae bacterium]
MATVVLDVGKTLTKLSLWDDAGSLLERRTRTNEVVKGPGYAALDAAGIESWLVATLREFRGLAQIDAIIPVGHGAAAAIVRGGTLTCPPMDYEEPMPDAERAEYDALRDDFAVTGSPALPCGLNLGAQLFRLERRIPNLLAGGAIILPWPQYWAWLFSGVAASEVTSLGCHSDLWRPLENQPSSLAKQRGWSRHLAPMRKAGDVLGKILPAWAQRTGLSPSVRIHCGIHDSNAALVAARAFAEIDGHDATVLSTGTWFIAMRLAAAGSRMPSTLVEARDCLVNVDADGDAVPSARFMGGREIEMLLGTRQQVDHEHQRELLHAVGKVLANGAMALPAFVAGCGPFARSQGRWIAMPQDPIERRAAAGLYAALVTDASLELIGARDRLLIEGRFAHSEVFTRALASLRPQMQVLACKSENDASWGALTLVRPTLKPAAAPARVAPLAEDLTAYRQLWAERAHEEHR